MNYNENIGKENGVTSLRRQKYLHLYDNTYKVDVSMVVYISMPSSIQY